MQTVNCIHLLKVSVSVYFILFLKSESCWWNYLLNIYLGNTRNLQLSEKTHGGNEIVLESRVHPKYGRCLVYSPERSIFTKGLNSFKIHQNLQKGFSLRIFIHANDQFWAVTNRQMGYKLDPYDVATAQVIYGHDSIFCLMYKYSMKWNVPLTSKR